MRIIFSSLFFFLIAQTAFSQSAYLYIEGIRGIPFFVAVNGQAQANISKGYSIISFAQPGEKRIDISFINDNFEKQQFVVDAVDSSAFAFKLAKTELNKFYLIDLLNDGKIVETNTSVNIALASERNKILFYQADTFHVVEQNKLSKISRKERKQKLEDSLQKVLAFEEKKDEKKYGVIDSIVPDKSVSNPVEPVMKESPKPIAYKKSSCSQTIPPAEIDKLAAQLVAKTDDDAKLLYFKKKVFIGCYSANQMFQIAEKFDTQFGRYSLLKFALPLVDDISNLQKLDALFKYDAYKSKLKKLIEN
jgi:hypothetical protein